jgi:hypothetical protein
LVPALRSGKYEPACANSPVWPFLFRSRGRTSKHSHEVELHPQGWQRESPRVLAVGPHLVASFKWRRQLCSVCVRF